MGAANVVAMEDGKVAVIATVVMATVEMAVEARA